MDSKQFFDEKRDKIMLMPVDALVQYVWDKAQQDYQRERLDHRPDVPEMMFTLGGILYLMSGLTDLQERSDCYRSILQFIPRQEVIQHLERLGYRVEDPDN
jgi:hypothetical protein